MADTVLRRRVRRLPVNGVLVLSSAVLVAACSLGDGGPDMSAAAESATASSVEFGGVGDGDPGQDTPDPADDGGSGDAASTPAPSSAEPADDVAAVEAEVERVIRRNWEIWVECTTDVEGCEPADALAETESTTSQFYLESVGVIELWKQQGIAYRPVEGRADDRFVEIRSIDVAPDLMSAEVLLCDRDDRAQFQRGADGAYQLVQGTDIGEDLLLRRVVAIEDGEWKIVANELLDRRHVEEGIDPLC